MNIYGEDETWYDTAQVCREGHMVNDSADSQPVYNKTFCSKCGAATIVACPHCKAQIKGYAHISGVASVQVTEPEKFCDNCGHPYPWSESKLKAALDLAGELEGLTAQEKEDLKKSLPDLLATFQTLRKRVGREPNLYGRLSKTLLATRPRRSSLADNRIHTQ